MPSPKDIKVNNTLEFAWFIDEAAKRLDLKPATRLGASLSVFVNTLIIQAATEDLGRVQRTLERTIELLTEMRTATTPEELETIARTVSARQNAAVHRREAERRDH